MTTMTANGGPLATAPATQRASLIRTLAEKYGLDPQAFERTVKATCFSSKDGPPSNEDFAAFLVVANKYGLDPFTREIFAFPKKGGGIQAIVSIDGWSKLANDQPQFDGLEFEYAMDGAKPVSCTCTIYRRDRTRPTRVTEFFAECKRDTEPWRQFPMRMLRHKALKEAARLAFSFSGVTDEDEARDMLPVPTRHTENVGGPVSGAAMLSAPAVIETTAVPAAAEVSPQEEAPVEKTAAERMLEDTLWAIENAPTREDLASVAKAADDTEEFDTLPGARKRIAEAHLARGKALRPKAKEEPKETPAKPKEPLPGTIPF